MRISLILWTVTSSLALASPLLGQVPPAEAACLPSQIDDHVPGEEDPYWRLRHPKVLMAELAGNEAKGDWARSIEVIVSLVTEDSIHFPADQINSVLGAARSYQTRVEGALDALGGGPIQGAARYQGDDSATLFHVDQNRAGRIRLLAGGAGNQLVLPGFTDQQAQLFRSVCYAANSIRRFEDRLVDPARTAFARELQRRVARWDDFNDRGLNPYPWEMVANEVVGWLGGRETLEPPSRQLILLRPTVGTEVDSGLEDRTNVAVVEAFGFIQYMRNRSWYMGASAVWTSPAGSTTGFGLMVHLGPLIKAGPIWRDVDDDGDREARLLVSLDVLDLLRGPPGALLKAAQEATGGLTGN